MPGTHSLACICLQPLALEINRGTNVFLCGRIDVWSYVRGFLVLDRLYARHGSERYVIRERASSHHVAAAIATSNLYRHIYLYIDSPLCRCDCQPPILIVKRLSPTYNYTVVASPTRCRLRRMVSFAFCSISCWSRFSIRFESHIGIVEDNVPRSGGAWGRDDCIALHRIEIAWRHGII